MEKLIELLNEYEKSTGIVFNIWTKEGTLHYYDNYKDENIYDNVKLLIISKQYGFIKWLIENDKIDLFSRNALFISEDTENGEEQRPYSFYEEMLIRLAISDTPIEDLLLYLK